MKVSQWLTFKIKPCQSTLEVWVHR
uniref:Uncharacterized protein n=1 Tax=Anguilla anguilla TaxID=7936 RepID=A0A0E9S7M7_ANGAN